MAASKAGSVLLIIAGIINAIITLAVFLVGVAALPILSGFLFELTGLAVAIYLLIFLITLGVTILSFYCAKWMKNPSTTFQGGLVALVLGVLTGNLFSLAGGIVGVIHGKS